MKICYFYENQNDNTKILKGEEIWNHLKENEQVCFIKDRKFEFAAPIEINYFNEDTNWRFQIDMTYTFQQLLFFCRQHYPGNVEKKALIITEYDERTFI